MPEKNTTGYPPSSAPPPYSTMPPPSYPIGMVMPGNAPGQAQLQSPPHHQHYTGQNGHGNGQTSPVIIYANLSTQFGPYPQRFTCPVCRAHVMTETRTKAGLLTYILSGTLLVLGFCLLCCLVPCCIRECQDIQHICPNCKSKLGLYKRI